MVQELHIAVWDQGRRLWHVSTPKKSIGFFKEVIVPKGPVKVGTVEFFDKGFGQVLFEADKCVSSEKKGKARLTCDGE